MHGNGRYLVLSLIFTLSCRAYYIPTNSMADTLKFGDHVYARFVIRYTPRRGDIVVFKAPNENKEYIKRIIAIPGDDFSIRSDGVYIDNLKINEYYARGATEIPAFQNKKTVIQGIVPAGKVVVLGDNRENSLDSRHFGYLDVGSIRYKPLLLYWNSDEMLNGNFSRMGFVK